MDGSKVGKNSSLVSENDAGALLIQRVARLRAKKVSLIQFIFQRVHSPSFHAYVDRINTSSGIPHISAKQIKEFRICFPSDEEQQRIADCLSSLDTLINTATQELETFKTHKKGLMQQLFPSAEALEA
jgi:type I restriction enzyme S subunit